MRKYELAVVIPGKSTNAQKKKIQDNLDKTIKSVSGKVLLVDDWGEKSLAYDIKRNRSGIFLVYDLEMAPDNAKKLDQTLRLEQDIIRYLLVKEE